MKLKLLIMTGIVCFLAACGPFHKECGYCNKDKIVITPRCGTCIVDRCQRFCGINACTFNEPNCQTCWSCVSYDSCERNSMDY